MNCVETPEGTSGPGVPLMDYSVQPPEGKSRTQRATLRVLLVVSLIGLALFASFLYGTKRQHEETMNQQEKIHKDEMRQREEMYKDGLRHQEELLTMLMGMTAPDGEPLTDGEPLDSALKPPEAGWSSEYKVTLHEEPSEDLGDRINALLTKSSARTVSTTLTSGVYNWDKRVVVDRDRVLNIEGEGWANGAKDITVFIHMYKFGEDQTYTRKSKVYHNASHLIAKRSSQITIKGVNIYENSFDDTITEKSPQSAMKATFALEDGVVFELVQTRTRIANNLINAVSNAYVRVILGHTYVTRHPDYPVDRPDPYVVIADAGWGFGGNGVTLSHSYSSARDGAKLMKQNQAKSIKANGYPRSGMAAPQ